jgi:hypothetical protein
MGDLLIAAVTCPKCGKEYALLNTPLYKSWKQPRKFPDPDTITFPCAEMRRLFKLRV